MPQAKANARFHYGLGNAFYRPWLDAPAMMYTCAYWSEGTTTLEEAQRNKMDHVCRKVQLQPGETFVDVGCGWGGLLFHAWERYGAPGTGINATTEQVAELRAEIARRGLDDDAAAWSKRLPRDAGPVRQAAVDRHARARGAATQLPEVVRAHADALKPGGLGVIHFIGHVGARDTEFFIRKYIFPGGWIPSLSQAIDAMERCGLEVLDVENLRRHYALTLDCWARALRPQLGARSTRSTRSASTSASAASGARTCGRAPRCFAARTSQLNLFQVTVSKGNVGSRYPMSRGFPLSPMNTAAYADKKARLARGLAPRTGGAGRPDSGSPSGRRTCSATARRSGGREIDLSHFRRGDPDRRGGRRSSRPRA